MPLLRPVRALRVLLACVFLWFGATPSAPHAAWDEAPAIVVVDGASARAETPALDSDERTATDHAAISIDREGPPTCPATASAPRPTLDLYLRNCALLC
jgi:hypothetical protein